MFFHLVPRRALAVAALTLLASSSSVASGADEPAPLSADQSKSSASDRKDTEWWAAPSASKVDSFGAFSDSIPIEVPSFREITPTLSLGYRSSGGNGWAGVGWNLDGVSLIERASPGKGAPKYDSSDIYLLDGEELVACIAGSVSPSCTTTGTHSTKTENYRRIKLAGSGTAATWTITDKDGTKSVFAPVVVLPGPDGSSGTADDVVYKWGLSQVIDTKNNVVTYNWANNQFGGSWEYLDSITYNGSTIKLYWEQRTDIESSATGAGGLQTVYGRIKTIDVLNASRVRSYKLTYTTSGTTSRSLLASVRQYGKNATLDASGTVTGGTAYPAINAGYSSGGTSFVGGTADTVMGSSPNEDRRYITLDFDGDGKTDMLEVFKTCFLGCTYKGVAWKSTGTGFTQAFNVTIPSYGANAQFLAMDVNGDGKDDFVSLTKNGTKWKRTVNLSTGTAFAVGTTDSTMLYKVVSVETSEADEVVTSHFLPMDIDGDGKTDLLELYPNPNCYLCATTYHRTAWISNGSAFTAASTVNGIFFDTDSQFYGGDFNGDGKSDFIEVKSGVGTGGAFDRRVYLSNGTGFTLGSVDSSTHNSTLASLKMLPMDINGDGKTDLLELVPEPFVGSRRRTWISTGSSFVQTSSVVLSGQYIDEKGRYLAADLNGDGRSDYIAITAAVLSADRAIFLSKGDDFIAGTTDTMGPQAYHRYFPADANGDGRTDLIELYNAPSTKTGRRIWAIGGSQPDLLTSLSTRYGGTTTVSYTPSSAWTNTNNPPVVQTANSVTVADGRGGSSTTTYSFSGGKMDAARERFLGFAYQKTTQPCITGESSCPYAEAWFGQDYGSTGKPTRIDLRDGTAKLLRSHVYEYTGSGATVPWTALQTGRWSYTYVGTGAACPGADCKRRYSSRAFNAYGEITQEVGYGDYDTSGDESTVSTTYVPNTTAYIVDQPADVKTFQGTTTGGTLLNETLAYYDGATTWNQAPSAGFPTKTAKWLATPSSFVTTQKEYDSWGNVTAEINELGARTEFTFDSTYHVFPTSVTNALGQVTTTTWGLTCPVPTQTTDMNGQATTFAYDSLCRMTQKTSPGGGFENHSWVSLGTATDQYEQIEAPAADGTSTPRWSRLYFDGLGRTWRAATKGPNAATGDTYVDTTFNARGEEASKTAPYYFVSGSPTTYVTTYGYDALDRPVRITHPDAAFATTSYGLWSVTTTDELGRSQTDRFNAYGNPIAHDETVGGATKTTSYVYDSRQNLQQTTDPAGNITTTLTTDSLGRVTQQVDIDWGTTTYEYDVAGRLTAKTDAKNQRTTFGYDALDRKTSKTRNAGTAQAATVSWTYDQARAGFYNVGALTTLTDAAGTKTFDHDVLGRTVKTVRTISGSSYTSHHGFDAGGRVLWTTYPDGDTLGTSASPLLYDSAGRLKTIPGYVTSATYDADGDVRQITNVNGTVTTRTYSAQRGWLTGISTVKGATTLQNLGYTRNAKGMVTTVTSAVADEGWTYSYDELDRLTTATNASSSAHDQTLAYDAIGNITSNSLVGSYTYHATKKHAVATAGANTYAYDMTGLMTSGAGRTLTWNGDNQLATVTSGGVTSTMTYDANGDRIQQVESSTTRRYLGDDYEVVDDTTVKYVTLGGVPVATKDGSTKLWIHTDQLGSIQAETDASGVEVHRKKYRPYGEVLSSSGTQDFEPRGYTGQRHDGSGLVYLHARYYDGTLGRFISADDIIDGGKTVGLNRYAYTGNDPINHSDVSGHCQRKRDGTVTPQCANSIRQRETNPRPHGEEGLGETIGWAAVSLVPVGGALLGGLKDIQDGVPAWQIALGAVPFGRPIRTVARKAACFVAGTLVHTPDGQKPIEDVRAGDSVWAHDEATGATVARRVVRTFATPDQPLLEVAIDAGEASVERLRATAQHPFWTHRGWVEAGQLTAGDLVLGRSGEWTRVVAVQETNQRATVFNFEVEQAHNYFVGERGVLVHNDCFAPYPNRDPNNFENEVLAAAHAHIVPSRMGTPGADAAMRSGEVKWVVTKDGDLVVAPLGKGEIKHPVLADGKDVLAAGTASFGTSNGRLVPGIIDNYSGHYLPSHDSVWTGVEAFERHGIEFDFGNVRKVGDAIPPPVRKQPRRRP